MQGMDLIVRTVARLAAGFFAAFGMYLALYGHLGPAAGGLAGGALVAASLLLVLVAFGRSEAEDTAPVRTAARLQCVGAVHLLVVGLAGLGGGYFLYNLLDKGRQFHVMSSGTVLYLGVGVAVATAAGLYAGVRALVTGRPEEEAER